MAVINKNTKVTNIYISAKTNVPDVIGLR